MLARFSDRRINDLSVLLDAKSHNIRSNTAAIRTLEALSAVAGPLLALCSPFAGPLLALSQSGLSAVGSDVRSSAAKIGEHGVVQDVLRNLSKYVLLVPADLPESSTLKLIDRPP